MVAFFERPPWLKPEIGYERMENAMPWKVIGALENVPQKLREKCPEGWIIKKTLLDLNSATVIINTEQAERFRILSQRIAELINASPNGRIPTVRKLVDYTSQLGMPFGAEEIERLKSFDVSWEVVRKMQSDYLCLADAFRERLPALVVESQYLQGVKSETPAAVAFYDVYCFQPRVRDVINLCPWPAFVWTRRETQLEQRLAPVQYQLIKDLTEKIQPSMLHSIREQLGTLDEISLEVHRQTGKTIDLFGKGNLLLDSQGQLRLVDTGLADGREIERREFKNVLRWMQHCVDKAEQYAN